MAENNTITEEKQTEGSVATDLQEDKTPKEDFSAGFNARIIVVTSGKGGVGKTTSSAALSSGLALEGHKTCVIDFDVGLRNLDLVMGCERRVVYDLVNVIRKEATLNQALIKDKNCDRLFILPASQTRDKDALFKEGVARVLHELDDMGFEYKVNVNLSVVQLLQTDIFEIVRDIVARTEINPRNLTLEVTESLAINDMERMKEILNKIKSLGVRIALDDFGTGYSSLNHIREIPFDVIKVDQGFVKELSDDAYSQSFIKMVAELASTIGVSICVEGIETKEQYKVLEGMKVRLVQGYFFDRPMPKKNFLKKYINLEAAGN